MFSEGYKQSLEHRRKLSEANKGHRPSEETRKKMSRNNVGMRGKKHSVETRTKMSKALMGDKRYNWKGGVVSLALQIRQCFKSRQWRSDVFTRDDFTCVLCYKKGGYLEADHYPKMFSVIFHENSIKNLEEALACEELWNINNGRTLCRSCHEKETLKIYKKR